MYKNEIFTFTAPNGAEVTAVCLKNMGTIGNMTQYLCYGQNRLFTMNEFCSEWIEETGEVCKDTHTDYGEVIVEHVTIPDYDIVLEEHHYHKENVKFIQSFGFTETEADNILDGKNADGTDFEQLPF